MAGPAAPMVGDQPPVAPDPHPVQVGADLDAAADHRRVDRVVVAVQADVVVARQPQRGAPPGHRRHRRQRQHRGPVGLDPVGRGAAQHPAMPLVGQHQPVGQLGVEVGRRGEAAAGQERGLQIAVGPLDQPLGLRIARVADQDLGAQHPTKRVRRLGQDRLAAGAAGRPRPPRPTPAPAAPPPAWPSSCHQPANRSSATRDGSSRAHQPAGIAGHHHQHRQPRGGAGLAEPHRQRDVGEPQVTLGHLPSRIRRPRRRVRRQVHRPQLPHPVLEHRQPPGPADPLGDHRGWHRRPRRQQLPDPRLDPIHDRPPRRPLIPRRPIVGQRPLHGVLRDPITLAIALIGIPSARCNRRISAQSSTPNTPLPPQLGSSQGLRGVSFRPSIWGSVFTRRRQRDGQQRTCSHSCQLLVIRGQSPNRAVTSHLPVGPYLCDGQASAKGRCHSPCHSTRRYSARLERTGWTTHPT